ncbi:hypothetical protein [Roseisalinus antarcticus]|uniref:Uncharacterized protein n=1 Tax=Roseisalinus antarcticus TaxID=254357 RepID=A0A1Y5RY20_9RHOB|nr:hypothetical protein [Roseisalinus antarcticus]SLN28004.1 hypothetical protein ROA7023_00925 [Roseisalinus antarcticus]
MTRLILALLLLSVAVITVQIVGDFVRPRPARSERPSRSVEIPMPETFRTIAYVLLLLLALGVTSGLLGGS